jgi:flagellar hook-associated protein 1 FlgK
LQMAKDGSVTEPVTPVDTSPTHEVIRKLRSQMDTIAHAFLDRTKPGQPTSFADAYTFTGTANAGELDQNFFTGKDRFNFALNFDLLDGSATVKESAVTATSGALTVPGRSFTPDGLVVSDGSYGDLIANFVSKWSLTKSQADDEAASADDIRDQLMQRYQSEVGVNLDDEIVRLQVLQRNYSASAQVINATRDMLDSLERIFR